jgi:DNA-binding transcriptional LysR family regulator
MPQQFNRFINRLSLRQLQVFDAVYRLKSFSKAGEHLGMSQPAVSSQIRQLEQAANTQLFDYIGRKLYCTASGERVAQSVDHLFKELTSLHDDLHSLRGRVAGELKLTAVNTAQYFIPYLLKPFISLHPEIQINLKVVNRATAIEELNNNIDGLVIMGLVPHDKPLNSLPFLDNELVAVVPAEHPLRKIPTPSLREFFNHNLLLREPGSGSRLAIERFCNEQKINLHTGIELGSNETLKHAVMAGLGVAILPKLSILSELKTGSLQLIDLPGLPLKRSWCVVYPSAKTPTPTMKAFIDFIQQNIKQFEYQFKDKLASEHS